MEKAFSKDCQGRHESSRRVSHVPGITGRSEENRVYRLDPEPREDLPKILQSGQSGHRLSFFLKLGFSRNMGYPHGSTRRFLFDNPKRLELRPNKKENNANAATKKTRNPTAVLQKMKCPKLQIPKLKTPNLKTPKLQIPKRKTPSQRPQI